MHMFYGDHVVLLYGCLFEMGEICHVIPLPIIICQWFCNTFRPKCTLCEGSRRLYIYLIFRFPSPCRGSLKMLALLCSNVALRRHEFCVSLTSLRISWIESTHNIRDSPCIFMDVCGQLFVLCVLCLMWNERIDLNKVPSLKLYISNMPMQLHAFGSRMWIL